MTVAEKTITRSVNVFDMYNVVDSKLPPPTVTKFRSTLGGMVLSRKMPQKVVPVHLSKESESLLSLLEGEYPAATRTTIVNAAVKVGLESMWQTRAPATEAIRQVVEARKGTRKTGRRASEVVVEAKLAEHRKKRHAVAVTEEAQDLLQNAPMPPKPGVTKPGGEEDGIDFDLLLSEV
jgi:hypothetical protein